MALGRAYKHTERKEFLNAVSNLQICLRPSTSKVKMKAAAAPRHRGALIELSFTAESLERVGQMLIGMLQSREHFYLTAYRYLDISYKMY